MSQRELAARSGICQSTICAIESGSEGLFSTYERLAAAMGGRLVCGIEPVRPRGEIVSELAQARLEAERRRLGRRRRPKARTDGGGRWI